MVSAVMMMMMMIGCFNFQSFLSRNDYLQVLEFSRVMFFSRRVVCPQRVQNRFF